MSCLLSSFLIPQLKTPLPGVRFNAQGDAEIITQLFSCCQGGGFYYHQHREAYSRCQLHSRLQKLNRLCQLFRKIWGKPLAGKALLAATVEPDFLPWVLKHREQQPALKGRVFSSSTPANEPSYGLWAMAMMTVWRLGLDVHMLTLGKSGDAELLPPATFAQECAGVVFIEQKAPFWQPGSAFDFDVIINWCEGATIPLWVDVCVDPSKSEKPQESDVEEFSLDLGFARKLSKFKQRPPLSWLGSECCSRLNMLCSDVAKFMEA